MSTTTIEMKFRPPIPHHFESFRFGMFTCACCFDEVRGDRVRKRAELKRPIFGDLAETEVLIPAGLQSFCVDCYGILQKAGTV